MVFIEVSDSMPVLILKDVMVLTSSMISKYILSKDVKQLSILILYIIATNIAQSRFFDEQTLYYDKWNL